MKHGIKRILSFLLAVIMLMGSLSLTTGVFADENEPAAGTDITGAADDYVFEYDAEAILKLGNAVSYDEYTKLHEGKDYKEEEFIVYAADAYDDAASTVKSTIEDGSVYGDGSITDKVLVTPDSGNTVLKIDVPAEGRYAIELTYASVVVDDTDATEISTTIERMMYVDGEMPFSEARYLYFPRTWEYEYETDKNGEEVLLESTVYFEDGKEKVETKSFINDKNGNDTRPRRWEVPEWQTYYMRDWLGYEIDPLQVYFTEGEHTITLTSNREQMVIHSLRFYPYEEEISYEDFLKEMKKKGVKEYTGDERIIVQAENPTSVSVQNVIPSNDRTSSISIPQHPAQIRYNLLDNATANNWMKYEVEAPETGLYSLSFRFRQNTQIGMFTSRRVKINNEIQFREASYLRFPFETGFQSSYATNGEDTYLFYLEKGTNVVELEIVLGDMEQYVYRIKELINDLNFAYQEMLKITGPVPDSNRDYGFQRLVPEHIVTIANAANELYDIEESIVEMTGEKGDMTNTLHTIAELYEKMALNEYEIAPNFLTFKNYIISLSDWLYSALAQPLKLDFFVFAAADAKLPRAVSNGFEKAWFECKAFVASFTMDYTTIGFSDDANTTTKREIEMWAISDRESMLIYRYLVDNYFTPDSGISLRIKVITAGLTEAILAGIGPDVSFMDSANTITFGMRTALLPLENYEGFDEVMAQYPAPLKDKLTMVGKNDPDNWHTYGVPTNIIVPMTFYRLDVLAELGIEAPQSWDELLACMPALLNNNMDVGLPNGLVGTQLFVYQQEGGNMYKDNGKAVNLDDKVSLSAFKTMCEMFQKYSCPVAYDITRFRTGEVPIMVAEDAITTYNQLMAFYDIRGLWQMAPAIGTVREDGSINRTATVNTQAMIIPRGGEDPEAAWEYIKWYCGADSQQRQARENIAVTMPTNKFSTANTQVLLAQKWTEQERAAIASMLGQVDAVPEYPGSYILTQYVQFAFLNAYNDGQNPADAMLEQISYMNKELTRKRKEFGLDYNEISYDKDDKSGQKED